MNSLHTYEPACKDSLGKFEIEREEAYKQMMRKELQQEIKRRDDLLIEHYPRNCPICQGKLYAHGKTSTLRYLAVCGEVKIRLKRLYCTFCNHIVVPSRFLIPKKSISAPLAERMCDLASKIPYKKAAASMAVQHSIKISTKRFWAVIQAEATLIGG